MILEGNISSAVFFESDNDGWRRHEHKLFKKRFRFDVGIFAFNNRVVDSIHGT